MIKFAKEYSGNIQDIVFELYTKYSRSEQSLTMEDIVQVVNLRNRHTVLGTPVNLLDLEVTKDIVRRLATGNSLLSPVQVLNLYVRKEPELREVNHNTPETTGLPINFDVKTYSARERIAVEHEVNKLIEQHFSSRKSLNDIWHALPVKTVADVKYIIECMLASVALLSSTTVRETPWYDSGTDSEDDTPRVTPKLQLAGF